METVDETAVRAELAALCATFGKADVSRRLLTYLVECHLRGKVPKETDIALDVFHRDPNFDGSQDAVVRVAVRALRQRLDEIHHQHPHRSLRFELPRGAYRLTISPGAPAAVAESAPRVPARRRWQFAAGALFALSVIANGWFWLRPSTAEPVAATPASESPIWQPLVSGTRPLTIVLGDLLLFPNPTPDAGRIQLVRDARVNTAEQLRSFLGNKFDGASTEPGTQVATTLIPKSVAYGLVDVLPVVSRGARPVEVRILDELPVDDLRTHDVLFMGPLVRIGPFADALFRGSRYTFNYDHEPRRLRDVESGREFAPSTGRRENATDYGLFVSMRGPAGNRLMVFASVGSDLGLLPLMRSVTSAAGLAELHQRLTKNGTVPLPDEFEALVSVSGYYRTDLSAELIEAHARPLSSATVAAHVD
ncbi:MAG: hypothetical protein ABW136_03495 [Steroidobacteraceae bacterium]